MQTVTEQIEQLKVSDLVPSPWNRGDMGTNGELKELSENIKTEGVLVPLIVRPNGQLGVLEIVAGHRRYEAAKRAGLKEVPCIIRTMDDIEAKRVQVLENLHRKNLNPMEEARAFCELMRGTAHTHQSIADLVGKDVKYVYRSLELLKLPKKAQTALEKGIITAAHGHQLARVGPKQIDALTAYAVTPGWKGEIPSVVSLKQEIARRVERKLSAAPFEKTKQYAGKIACKGCPSNSANQDMLFDEAEEGFCTNGTCFSAKLKQFYKDLQAKGQERWPTLKFIGTATTRYGNTQVIKGYEVVEVSDPKVKKAMQELGKDGFTVEGFGFGILKPSNWGTLKVAKLVVLRKVTGKEKPNRVEAEDPVPGYRADFIFQFTQKALKPDYADLDKKRAMLQKEASGYWEAHEKDLIAEYQEKWKDR